MADLTGAERVVVDAWLPAAITSVAASLNAISPSLSTRVYLDMAPAIAAYPLIVFQCQDDPRDIRGVGITSVMSETEYLVKVVASADYASLGSIVSILNTVLTTAIGATPVIGGRVLSSVKERGFSMVEVDDGKQLRNLGFFLKIYVQGDV